MGRLSALPSRLTPLRGKVARMPKHVEPFYASAEWKATRAAMLAKGPAICAMAGDDCSGRMMLDHKVERKDGGADLDPNNLQWLCHRHHQIKTANEMTARAWRGGRKRRGGG